MSTENSVLCLPFEAAEDLSDYQYHFVVLDPTTGKIRLPDSAVEVAIGILQDAPESGRGGNVMVIGKSKLVANASIAIGKFVGPEYVGAADAGKATDVTTNPKLARAYVLSASTAEDELLSVDLVGPFPKDAITLIGASSVATIDTAGAATYTAAQLLGGLILRDPAGAARSDVTPTAALIVAALVAAGAGATVTGKSFEFTIKNTADAAETITVTAGVGVTLSGTMTIAQNNTKRFLCVMTAETTATIYSLGTAANKVSTTSLATITTAGAVTYTAAQILAGLIFRDPAGAGRSDVTPTGTLIAAALVDAGAGATVTGKSFEFTIRNTADADETITVTAGTDVTLSGTMTIAQSNTKRFLCVMTAETTATIYSLGTIVH